MAIAIYAEVKKPGEHTTNTGSTQATHQEGKLPNINNHESTPLVMYVC